MRTALWLTLVISCAALAKPAAESLTDEQLRGRVDQMLGALNVPTRPAEWQALGARAAPVLEEIAADEKGLPSRRAKAIAGLVSLAPPEAAERLSGIARDPKAQSGVRAVAVRALGVLLESPAATRAVQPLLSDADGRVRFAAASTLIKRDAVSGCGLVKARAAKESGSDRALFDALVARCSQSK